jgi:uncharacterized RDD family membrane protein YckC
VSDPTISQQPGAAPVAPPPPAAPPQQQPQYAQHVGPVSVAKAPDASVGKRVGAYFLDGLLMIVTLGIGWIVWSLVVWSKGQSPAKSLLGMQCIREDTGQPATWGTMFVREIVGKWLLGAVTFSITTLVSIFMILGESRQGVWDKVAKTVVVDISGQPR